MYDKEGKRIPPPLAPLPNHLIPKALGGTALLPQDELEKNSQRTLKEQIKRDRQRNMLSSIKKLHQDKAYQEEIQQQVEDAKFINELFDEQRLDDDDYAEQLRDEQYELVKQQLESDQRNNKIFYDSLQLPNYDEDENPAFIREQFMQANDDDEIRKQKLENERKKAEAKEKYKSLLFRLNT